MAASRSMRAASCSDGSNAWRETPRRQIGAARDRRHHSRASKALLRHWQSVPLRTRSCAARQLRKQGAGEGIAGTGRIDGSDLEAGNLRAGVRASRYERPWPQRDDDRAGAELQKMRGDRRWIGEARQGFGIFERSLGQGSKARPLSRSSASPSRPATGACANWCHRRRRHWLFAPLQWQRTRPRTQSR